MHHSNGTKIIESVRLDGTDVRISRIKGDCLVSQLSIAGSYLHILAQTPGGLAVHTSTDIHSALEEDSGHLRNELVLPGRKLSSLDLFRQVKATVETKLCTFSRTPFGRRTKLGPRSLVLLKDVYQIQVHLGRPKNLICIHLTRLKLRPSISSIF